MGVVLEAAKLVSASWVYRNWTIAPTLLKYYLSTAVVILSLITSMGIFGYLSKSHVTQATVVGVNTVELDILTQQESVLKQRINFLLSQGDKSTFVSSRINRELSEAQEQLKAVINKKAPLLQNKNQLESEIGPLKYITEFIYEKSDEQLINKAVRWVIITLIFVFDPLAILLLISANISFSQKKTIVQTVEMPPVKSFNAHLETDPGGVKIDKSNIFEITKDMIDRLFKK
jgi:hypothetical protein